MNPAHNGILIHIQYSSFPRLVQQNPARRNSRFLHQRRLTLHRDQKPISTHVLKNQPLPVLHHQEKGEKKKNQTKFTKPSKTQLYVDVLSYFGSGFGSGCS
ncbi:hypothetical protein PanWU01x14_316110 [Parasponia andersonii]|uniref:Uncharacterized protein n=1 Tax=Parasponia andersonii TaxID=3476 RepID=A0A2P5AN66_PARAD|nr:hypothetical protein PanWU01x14_316110 [Parasponia andersonii]